MATPITHIVLTESMYNNLFFDKDKKDFFIGTSLPDIRYLGVIAREKIHYKNLSLNSLKSDSSFLSGLKFHSILDEVRENFILSHNTYSLCPNSKYITQSLKFLEDQLYYHKIANWQQYIDYLKDVLPEELNFGIDKVDINKWHGLLQEYFQTKPDYKSLTNFVRGIGFSAVIADEIMDNVNIMRENKKIIQIIESLYINFNDLIKQ